MKLQNLNENSLTESTKKNCDCKCICQPIWNINMSNNIIDENNNNKTNSNYKFPESEKTKIQLSTQEETTDCEFVEPEDNYINRFFWKSQFGRICNFSLLTIGFYYAFIHSNTSVKLFTTKVMNLNDFILAMMFLAFEHSLLLLVVYPLSRLNKSKNFYWFIGTVVTVLIQLGSLFDFNGTITTGFNRFIISTEAVRVTMKIISFLSECNKNNEVFERTTFRSFAYFLFAPTLVYRPKYSRTKKVRLTRILYHLAWGATVAVLFARFFYNYLLPWCTFDIATCDYQTLIEKLTAIFISISLTYSTIIVFHYFELWCGFFGEILRFPNRRLFDDPSGSVAQAARNVNIVVSDFLSNYVYRPIYEKTKSRFSSLVTTFSISMFYHELVMSYVLIQVIVPNFILIIILSSLLLKKNLHPILSFIRFIIVLVGCSMFFINHAFEFFAWTSTVPNIEYESKFRLIPLSFPYLYKIFTQNNYNYFW